MWLRKARGESGVGEWYWPEDNSVVEVADEALAAELLAIPDGGYTKVDGPEPKPAAKPAAAAKAAAPAAAAAPAKAASAGK